MPAYVWYSKPIYSLPSAVFLHAVRSVRQRLEIYNIIISYNVMLKMSDKLSICKNIVRLLAIEILKFIHGLNPAYLNELVITHESKYDLRNRSRLLQPRFNTYRYGYNSFIYLGSKLWNSLQSHLKTLMIYMILDGRYTRGAFLVTVSRFLVS